MGKQVKIIHSQKVAGYLMLKGFMLLNREPSLKNKNKYIYIFNESDELLKALEEYNKFFEQNKHWFIRNINKI